MPAGGQHFGRHSFLSERGLIRHFIVRLAMAREVAGMPGFGVASACA